MTPDQLTFRPLSSESDYAACIELQKVTWGRDFSDAIPMSILKITQKAGGIAAGAFSPDGRLLGFVYGITGVKAGTPPQVFHWSHMLAVDPEARDLGLGTRLKLYQRELLLPLGVERVEWTYDPLEARNAHLNFNHLGAVPGEYVREMYEGEFGSELARGIGTDRFIVAWPIASERVIRHLAEGPPPPEEAIRLFGEAPVVGASFPEDEPLPGGSVVRVEIPASILDLARAYRASTRRAFEHYFGLGWRVEGYYRDPDGGRCYYGLTAPDYGA
jgi:predicted GNAT superfamily acetyltransferase